jgi:hypothetical protein
MPDKDPERVRTGRQGGLQGWTNTDADGQRYERMARVRENSPASDTYWAAKLGFDNTALTPEQRRQITTARKSYYANLRSSSVRGIKLAKAKRLEQRAAAIRAEYEAGA